MRTFRVLLATGMAATMLVALTDGAASAAASAEVCDKISLTEADLGQLGGKKFHASNFQKAAKAFKSGASAAPAKVKTAMKSMSGYYQKIGEADSANEAIASLSPTDTEKFGKASVVWGTFIAKNCA
jgi:Tfp pilus assembly protein PilF